MDPVSGDGPDLLGEEISPVRSKMATLANRSSFASFFLKNKKGTKGKADPADSIKPDPLADSFTAKPDPSEESQNLKEEPMINENFELKDDSIIKENFEAKGDPILTNETVNFTNEPSFNHEPLQELAETFSVQAVQTPTVESINNYDDDIIITEIRKTPRRKTPPKRKPSEIIEISDTEPTATLIDSDIEIILPRRSQRIRTIPARTKPPADIECISISSDDSERSKVSDLRRSTRISGTMPSTSIPLSDYSNMKRLNFVMPTSKATESIVVSDSPVKNATDGSVGVNPVTVILKMPEVPSVNSQAPPQVKANNQVPFVHTAPSLPVNTLNSSNTQQTSTPAVVARNNVPPTNQSRVFQPDNTATKPPVTNFSDSTAPASQIPAKPATAAAPLPIISSQAKPNTTLYPNAAPFVPAKPITSTTQKTTSPVKLKNPADYMPSNFMQLDPSLRDELMARLSQRENRSNSANANSTEDGSDPVTSSISATSTCSNTTLHEDQYIIFKVIQRLNPGTFDPYRTQNGVLYPSNSFLIYWKCNETFGAMKRRIAADLRISPFELVLTRANEGGGHSELFDSTRPSTLNIKGKNITEYAKLNINVTGIRGVVNEPVQKKPRKNAKTPIVNQPNSAPSSTPNSTASLGTTLPTMPPDSTAPKPQQQPVGIRSMLVSTNPRDINHLNSLPASLVHSLYLYTTSTYNLYKCLQQQKMKQVYDSLSFLQTAQEEMSKLTGDPVREEDDQMLQSMDAKMSQSQVTNSIITINLKTAASRNQSHSIKISSTATIAELLKQAADEYKISGTKVIFDGDVLKNTDKICDILEDDDMVEIK